MREPACRLARPFRLAVLLVAASVPGARADFTDVSASAGFPWNDVTFGLGWADLDGDATPDLLACRHFLRPVVYRNAGDGTFSSSSSSGPFAAADHHGPLLVDLDGDGDRDVYFTGGADGGVGLGPKHLYRNDGGFVFAEIAASVGLDDPLGRGRGSSATDLEGDGDVDLFVAKARRAVAPNSLYRNDGGVFSDVAAAFGVADADGAVGGVWGDFDGDGDPDLFVSGEEGEDSASRLYRNDGTAFTDVTAAMFSGLGPVAAAAWGDFDGDGDLDLATGRGDEGVYDAVSWNADSLSFFFNTRDGEDGVDGFDLEQSADSLWCDLYVLGFYRPDSIFIGAAGVHPGFPSPFVVTAEEAQGEPAWVPGQSVGIFLWTGDSGTWHVRASSPPAAGNSFAGIVTAGGGTIASVQTTGLEPYAMPPRGTQLWRNDGDFFKDWSEPVQIVDDANVRHVTWVDFDNDGRLDLHVLAKGDAASPNGADLLYRNEGGHFADVAAARGLTGPPKGLADACAWEDFDGDGDLDVALLSGASPRFFAVQETHRLYRNDGPVGNRLRVRLVGELSTREGLGARVTCVSPGAGRQVRDVAANAWRGSAAAIDPWFGLGADAVADTVRVEWPSGIVTTRVAVPAGVVTVWEVPATGTPSAATAGPGLVVEARPNPVRGAARIRIAGGPGPGARLTITDVAGRRVLDTAIPRDAAEIVWDGRDRRGKRAAAGVYVVRVRDAGREAAARLVLLP